MKQTNEFRLREEEVICGWKFKMQFLGCSEDLKLGGTDHELANLIHDIHALYKEKNANIKKAPSVIVTVNTQCINISGNEEDDVLFTFPLVYIKDVTTGVDIAPYSRTCVLVAKEHSKLKYRAFVLFSKSSARAAEFYCFTTSAFHFGLKRMENCSFSSFSTAEEAMGGASVSSCSSHEESPRDDGSFCEGAVFDTEHPNTEEEFGKIATESEKLLNKSSQHTVTVQFKPSPVKTEAHEKQQIKFNLGLKDNKESLFRSKADPLRTIQESTHLLLPNWLRRKLQKFSTQSSSEEMIQSV